MEAKLWSNIPVSVSSKECYSLPRPVRFNLEWRFENLSTYVNLKEDSPIVFSKGVTMADLGLPESAGRWRLGVRLHRRIREKKRINKYLSVDLYLTDEDLESTKYTADDRFEVKFKMQLSTGKDAEMVNVGWVTEDDSIVFPFDKDHEFWGYEKFCDYAILFGQNPKKKGCLKDDVVTVMADVIVCRTGTSDKPATMTTPEAVFTGRKKRKLAAAD
ncbi:uncharacterized protein LOC129583638 isoform X1 [Paramacrobiotus metropolitanus]|uniref:uncharacterized protein LOC129583638 isoform X1 n=1 Tax=Paramacrobiotus metropolitanus TaxID=2943436 RepID=UPI00244608A3|nr:uncharacterized protein LOC129583638 isoform X1 [Paramacrobiotus metropolitanus]